LRREGENEKEIDKKYKPRTAGKGGSGLNVRRRKYSRSYFGLYSTILISGFLLRSTISFWVTRMSGLEEKSFS